MQDLATSVQIYLREVLGISTPVDKCWEKEVELPYFLRDAFDFRAMELMGQSIVMAIDKLHRKPPLSEIRKWIDQVSRISGKPVLYATHAMASYERKRLIGYKVPFVVPGNQLYLPDLGLDLREYFRQRAKVPETPLSPASQAVLLTALLRRPWRPHWQPSEITKSLEYTPMTLSRVVKELTSSGLATRNIEDRSVWLQVANSPALVWEKATPMLRSPVKRTIWVEVDVPEINQLRPLAGLSALASLSMLAEPICPVYAVTSQQWKEAERDGVKELPEYVSGAQEWQIWSYSPTLLPGAPVVDVLSLTLSLQDSADDRVQLGLQELKGKLPW
ncbi:MAG: hypothetical protein KAY82_01450 [Hylemonella sp.]|nr:hypothetical protein [Hylemonella sp.]